MKNNEEAKVNQNENETPETETKKEKFVTRVWNKIPKPVKVLIIGAGAIGGAMVVGKVVNPDRGGYLPGPSDDYPFDEDPGIGTEGDS